MCDQSNMGSDHYLIKCSIGMEMNECLEEYMHRWRFKKANWEEFKDVFEIKMAVIDVNVRDVEEQNNKIVIILCGRANEIIGKNKNIRKKKAVPWWTDECSEVIKVRNKALKKVKLTHSFDDLIAN